MRKGIALLLAMLLLLSGCSEAKEQEGVKTIEALTEKTAVSMEEGHFFFAGKVLSASTAATQITYYDAQTDKNTFYRVAVTEDIFGCMPAREITVCVLGSKENFVERSALEEGKEYIFDTTLWVNDTEAVFLLPTFYAALPERAGSVLYYTEQGALYSVDGDYAAYKARLNTLAEENGYSAERVLSSVKALLKSAAEKDAAYFEKLKFEGVDGEYLKKAAATAARLQQKAENTAADWAAIKELLA